MNEPTNYASREVAAAVKAECDRLWADIDMFIRMGFELGELGILSVPGERDEVVPTTMMENE